MKDVRTMVPDPERAYGKERVELRGEDGLMVTAVEHVIEIFPVMGIAKV